MKRARKVSLGGHTITVKWRNMSDFAEEEDMLVDGFWEPGTQTIHLNASPSSASGAQDTLIHECIHAIDDTYQLGLKHRDVHVLATALQQMLKPWLKKV